MARQVDSFPNRRKVRIHFALEEPQGRRAGPALPAHGLAYLPRRTRGQNSAHRGYPLKYQNPLIH